MEDTLYRFKKFYENSPVPFKIVAGTLYRLLPVRIRMGKQFRNSKELIRRTEFLPKERIMALQWKLLSRTLDNAFNMPFYKRKYRGIKRSDIRSFKDFEKLPFTEKEEAKALFGELLLSKPKDALMVKTSGTTGTPMDFMLEKGISRPKELAFMEDQWKRVGYRRGDRTVILRGYFTSAKAKGKFHSYEPVKNALILSGNHMTEENLPSYVQMIRDYRPAFIQAYPSTLYILAVYMHKRDLPPFHPLKALLLGSETLYDFQKELFRETFRVDLYSWYGHNEKAILGGFCEYEDTYHFYPQYGYAELIDKRGNIITRSGQKGEIVGTSFDNSIMPLIRYRTNDLGVYGGESCPSCKRNYKILTKIEGRLQEFIISKTGRKISMSVVNLKGKGYDNIVRMQFYQEKKGAVEFRFIPKKSYSRKDQLRIIRDLRKQLGDDIKIRMRPVRHIRQAETGKQGYLLQMLDVKNGR